MGQFRARFIGFSRTYTQRAGPGGVRSGRLKVMQIGRGRSSPISQADRATAVSAPAVAMYRTPLVADIRG
jgi:hypothetical protein